MRYIRAIAGGLNVVRGCGRGVDDFCAVDKNGGYSDDDGSWYRSTSLERRVCTRTMLRGPVESGCGVRRVSFEKRGLITQRGGSLEQEH